MYGRVKEHCCPPPLWFGGFIVTQALSPIDTSGNVPGEGQICCRIKLIYQMIECESKATLLEKMQKGLTATPPVAMIHEWLGNHAYCVFTCECLLYVNLLYVSLHKMNWFDGEFCMERIHGVFKHAVVRLMFLFFKMLLYCQVFWDFNLKACSLTPQPATISGFAALAADMNHCRNIEQMETRRDGFGSDS